MKKQVVGVLVLGAAVLLSSCTGSPRGAVAVINLKDATATSAVQATATATQEIAPTIQATETQADVAATPTTAATDAPSSTPEYVAAWLLFGTPTPSGQSADQPTAVASEPTATAATSSVTSATLPPTATTAAVSSAPTKAPSAGSSTGGHTGGNPKAGQQVFTGLGGCSSCHDITSGQTIVGPSLKGVAVRAGEREPGVAAEDYIYESITTPNKYVVKGFAQGIMPQTFKSTLSAKQINDVIAYLMTLK